MPTSTRAIGGGIVGGLVGASVMAIILVASKVMVGLPSLADFMVMGTFVGGSGGSVVPAGFAAHFLVGVIDGVIFAAIVTSVRALRPTSWGKSAGLGLLFGLVVYILIFLPVSITGFAPIMMTMMGSGAAAMMPMVQGISVVEHLVFGLIVGVTIFAGTKKVLYKCQACRAVFGSEPELMEHTKTAHPMPAR